jgi:hypothetical protein
MASCRTILFADQLFSAAHHHLKTVLLCGLRLIAGTSVSDQVASVHMSTDTRCANSVRPQYLKAMATYVHWSTRKHALANMVRRLGVEKRIRSFRTSMQQTLLHGVRPPGRWFSLVCVEVSACRLKPFTTR